MKNKKAASLNIQKRWIPKNFCIDDEFGCLTNAENLIRANHHLGFQVGRTRILGDKKWGDHAWCVTPKGDIIDPYFQWRFPKQWRLIEYVKDLSAFDGDFS